MATAVSFDLLHMRLGPPGSSRDDWRFRPWRCSFGSLVVVGKHDGVESHLLLQILSLRLSALLAPLGVQLIICRQIDRQTDKQAGKHTRMWELQFNASTKANHKVRI